MTTLTMTQQLLKELKIVPNKRLGQNFLIDNNVILKALSLIKIHPREAVVEIGPGLGALTALLLEEGSTVYAVEKDRALYNFLKDGLGKKYPQAFHLLQGDALEYPLANLPNPEADYAIIANLPFNISTPWMQTMLQKPLPNDVVLFLQLEAAKRFIAVPGTSDCGAISTFIAGAFEVAHKFRVSANVFYPKPNVDSMVLHLCRKKEPFRFAEKTQAVIRNFFNYRRKQIQKLVREMAGENPELNLWLGVLQREGVPFTIRPEAIPLRFWQELDRIIC